MKCITSWAESFSTEDTNAIVKELALAHLAEASASATREHIRALVCSDNYRALCDYDISYNELQPLDAYHLRSALALYSKRDDLPLGIDRKAVAFQKFIDSESLCRQTNEVFKSHSRGGFQFSPRVEGILHAASRKIAKVLGPVPSLSMIKGRFGPGATTAVKRNRSNHRNKLGGGVQCSRELLPRLTEMRSELPHWLSNEDGSPVDVQVVYGKIHFVPKNAKTDRTIGVEPVLNSFFQLGVGSYIQDRLLAFGIDLRDQSRNQRLARYGSSTGELATLDLSSASDTIATELVAHLLPVDWFLFLSELRTGQYEVEGRVLRLQKFSSMGNGFTFPLETLIFWALAASCCSKTDFFCSVYGDDIVIPSADSEVLCEVLHAVGFIVNQQKSFTSGPFRESCGKDYLLGFDIRPFYLRTRLSGELLYTWHNFYVRSGYADFAARLLRHIHPVARKYGPDGYGDGHLLGDWAPRPCKRSHGYGGFTFETHIWKPKRDFKLSLPGDRVLPLYTIYAGSTGVSSEGGLPLDPRTFVQDYQGRGDSSSRFTYDRRGRLGQTLPGRDKVKLISIYTFTM